MKWKTPTDYMEFRIKQLKRQRKKESDKNVIDLIDAVLIENQTNIMFIKKIKPSVDPD